MQSPSVALLLGSPNSDDRANRPDARSRSDRRAGRKRYRKAQKHYGKTYILTKKQVIGWLAAWVGSVLILSGGISLAFMLGVRDNWVHMG